MYGFVRRDSEGRAHPGFTTYMLISVGVFVVCFYVLMRFNAQPEPKMSKKEVERRLVPTNVSSLNTPLNTWQVSEFSENGENVIVREKEKKNILSSRSSIFSPIKSVTFKADAIGVANRLNFQEIKQLKGDNGGTYVKSDFGVYTLNVQAGTELKGKRNSFVVGDDLKLYRIYDGGKRSLVNEALPYKLTDSEGRFYTITDSMQLRHHTPGGPGRFVGPDNTAYNILESGDMEKSQDNTLVSSISGEGEFVGSDDKRYIVMQGLLFAPASENVSFSNGSIGGSGYFTGPDGKTYMLGEDGKIYKIGDDGKVVPSNIGGSGSFTGPDGATYIKDANGEIRRVLGTGTNGIAQKTSLSEGVFIGPDGTKYYIDKDGNVYSVSDDGSLNPVSIAGEGTFVGPDGKKYKIIGGKIIPDEKQAYIALPAKGKYLTANDGKRYYIDKDGRTFLVDKNGKLIPSKLPKGVLRDADRNSYVVDADGNVSVDSEALPMGTYTDANGQTYYVDKDGRFYRVDESGNIVPAYLSEGILKSQGGTLYSVDKDGRIRLLDTQKSGTGAIPKGYFYGPDGKLKYSDGKGKIYEVGPDGTIVENSALPQGSFVGPDGRRYIVDADGKIRMEESKAPEDGLPMVPLGKFQPEGTRRVSGKSSAKVDVSANLQNYNNGDENFNPAKEAGKLKGGKIYTMAVKEDDTTRKPPSATDLETDKIIPVGTRIPFYTLTHISTNFESGSLIEAVVAENVFFHKYAIPAGTRIYGSVGDIGSNNRIKLNFNFLLYPDGKSIAISADAYDVNMQFGLEAYFTPTPAWVYALRFLNVASIYELTKNQGHSPDGEPIGNIDEVVSYLNDTIKEIEHKQQAYYTLPAGTPGVLMLTTNLNLSSISQDGNNVPAKKAEALLTEKERLERMKTNVAMKRQELLLEQASKGVLIEDNSLGGYMVQPEENIPPATSPNPVEPPSVKLKELFE